MPDEYENISEEDLEEVEYDPEAEEKQLYLDSLEDEFGHIWEMGWQDGDVHPGFGTCGGVVGQCAKCGMYAHNFTNQKCEKSL